MDAKHCVTGADTVISSAHGGTGRGGERQDSRYQTERKRTGDYSKTRWNSSKWQLRREDIMVCTGNRCPYRFCDLPDEGLPSVGTLCPWERDFASLFSHQLSDLLGSRVLQPYIDENPDLVREWTVAFLLANRASVRLSRATEHIGGATDRSRYDQAILTLRYMTAAHNRINAIWEQLEEVIDAALARRREALIRTEMLAAGYWSPLRGDDPPAVEDAPAWILEKVDGGATDGAGG